MGIWQNRCLFIFIIFPEKLQCSFYFYNFWNSILENFKRFLFLFLPTTLLCLESHHAQSMIDSYQSSIFYDNDVRTRWNIYHPHGGVLKGLIIILSFIKYIKKISQVAGTLVKWRIMQKIVLLEIVLSEFYWIYDYSRIWIMRIHFR